VLKEIGKLETLTYKYMISYLTKDMRNIEHDNTVDLREEI